MTESREVDDGSNGSLNFIPGPSVRQGPKWSLESCLKL